MKDSSLQTRIDLALEQLDVALELFLEKRSFISALTLAGASEEILGRTLKLRGRGNISDMWHDEIHEVWGVPRKEFMTKFNHARNAAKHLANEGQKEIDFKPEYEAVWMLVRACHNHELLGNEQTDRMQDFHEWFYSEFIGV